MIDPVKETSDIAEQIFGKDYRTQVTFQARIKLAKMNIAYLQRYGRLVKRGLTEMKDNLRWWQLYSYLRWRIDWFFYEKSLSLRIKELVVSWVDFGRYAEVCFDQQTAAEFLPILQHFIETGELPE